MSEKQTGLALHWKILIGIVAGVALGALFDAIRPESGTLKSVVDTAADLGTGAGGLFLDMLKMLVVPLIMSSLITGIVGVPDMRGLRRMSGWTFGYYLTTSLIAITIGVVAVNVINPGDGVSYDKLAAAAQSDGHGPHRPRAAAGRERAGMSVLGKVMLQRMIPSERGEGGVEQYDDSVHHLLLRSCWASSSRRHRWRAWGGASTKFFESLIRGDDAG